MGLRLGLSLVLATAAFAENWNALLADADPALAHIRAK
jgi:hypothetical protein